MISSPFSSSSVLVDYRERFSGIPRLLERRGVPVVYRSLPVGDYLIPGGAAVERKTTRDLLRSLEDGRLFRQVSDLKRCYSRPVVLIQGPRPWAPRGVLISLAVRWQVPVLYCKGRRDAADLLYHLVLSAGPSSGESPVPYVRKLPDSREQALHLLLRLPGVGPVLARRLLEAFGSPLGVLGASEEALRGVPGVGPWRAQAIRRVAGGGDGEVKSV